MECSSLAPAILRVCLTLVESARATSNPRPATARAPAPAIPALRKSRRVTAGIAASPLTAPTKQRPDAISASKRCQVSACRDQEVTAVVRLGIAEQVQDALVPGHDHAGGAGRLVGAQRLGPGGAIGRDLDRDPCFQTWVAGLARQVRRLDFDDGTSGRFLSRPGREER